MVKQTELKKCSKCKIDKIASFDFFPKCNGNSDGFSYWCKECHSNHQKNRMISEQEKQRNRERALIWYQNNRERANKRNKIAYLMNPEIYKIQANQWKMKNPDRKKKLDREWIKNNSERSLLTHIKWRKANPEKYKLITKRARIKRMSTAKGRLDHSMTTAINKALSGNKNGRHWEILVGYMLNDLMKHLEKLFKPGMNWKNYGKWHIDHIIPKSVFNYIDYIDFDFKRCWALSNLQPLWAKENHNKYNKLENPFQPCLSFSSIRRENCVQT